MDALGWVLLSAALTGASFLVRKLGKPSDEEKILNERIVQQDRVGIMKICEQIINENHKLSLKSRAAQHYCANAVFYADKSYEKFLSYVKRETERDLYHAIFYLNIGDYTSARKFSEKILSSSDKKYHARAYDIIGESYWNEKRYDKAYTAYMCGAEAAKGKNRAAFVVDACNCANNLCDAERFDAVRQFCGKKIKNDLMLQQEELEGRLGLMKKRGIDGKAYMEKLFAGLEPYNRKAFALKITRYNSQPSSYVGGTLGYDNDELREQHAVFFAQLALSDIPDERYRKPYKLRFWVTNAHEEIADGIYKCAFVDATKPFNGDGSQTSSENGVQTEKVSDVATVIKCSGKNFRAEGVEEREKYKRNNAYISLGLRFVSRDMFPPEDSAVMKKVCEENGLPLPKDILGKMSPFKRESFWFTGGYPQPVAGDVSVEDYDFCLIETPTEDNIMYSYRIRTEDYLADRYDDVIFVKQKQ